MLAPNARVFMITGANGGIGLAAAHVLSGLGFRLSLDVRDPKTIDQSKFGASTLVSK